LLASIAFGQERRLPNPISFPGAPWAFLGFVVHAPDTPDLFSQLKTPVLAVIAKKIAEPDHSYTFTVAAHRAAKELSSADELLAYVRERRAKRADPSRFTLSDHTEEKFVHRDYWCTMYSMVAETHGSGSAPLTLRGMTCLHPDRHDYVVDLGFSERGGGKQVGAELVKIGEKFVGSLRFLPFPDRTELKQALEAARANEGEKALAVLHPLVEKGDTQAAVLAGEIHMLGYGAERDFGAARRMFELAARDGHVKALYNLGLIYERAMGVQRKAAEAIKWFKLAADQRDHQAQFDLAILYEHGKGVPRDPAEAGRWRRMAANNGNERAKEILQGQ
jgi:hypothetical protein